MTNFLSCLTTSGLNIVNEFIGVGKFNAIVIGELVLIRAQAEAAALVFLGCRNEDVMVTTMGYRHRRQGLKRWQPIQNVIKSFETLFCFVFTFVLFVNNYSFLNGGP